MEMKQNYIYIYIEILIKTVHNTQQIWIREIKQLGQ